MSNIMQSCEDQPISRLKARGILGITLASVILCVGLSLSPMAQTAADRRSDEPADVALYWAEVKRIADGQGYYAAAAEELRQRHYPTRSVFNWRTPLPMWLIGVLPDPMLGGAILGLLALAVLMLSFALVARHGGIVQAGLCALLLVGPLLLCLPAYGDNSVFVIPVLWAGVLIAISVCAYGLDRPGWGVAFGLLALFFRELAGLYCVLAMGIALFRRRFKELGLWAAGLAAYAAFFAWHAIQVNALARPDDLAHAEGWLQFGAGPFILATMQINAFLLLLPQWVTAIYFPIAILGFATWQPNAFRHAQAAAFGYVLLFAAVGHDFNLYWGSLTAPVFCLGAAHGLAALKQLWQAATQRQSSPSGDLTTAGG